MGIAGVTVGFPDTFRRRAASVLRRSVFDATAFSLLQHRSLWETGRLLSRDGNGLVCPSRSRSAYAGVGGLSCRRPWRRSLT
jgi:hypothetical protein